MSGRKKYLVQPDHLPPAEAWRVLERANFGYPPPPVTTGNTIGDYYRACDERRNYWHKLWCQAKAEGKPAAEVAWLERKMFEAGNTGD